MFHLEPVATFVVARKALHNFEEGPRRVRWACRFPVNQPQFALQTQFAYSNPHQFTSCQLAFDTHLWYEGYAIARRDEQFDGLQRWQLNVHM